MVYNVFELLINTELEPHFIDCDGIGDLLAIVFKTNHNLVALLVKMVVDQLELPNAMGSPGVDSDIIFVVINTVLESAAMSDISSGNAVSLHPDSHIFL
jgi:hypothetical protein